MPNDRMPVPTRNTTLSVGLVATPDASSAVLYGLHEVFRAVGRTWGEVTGQRNTPRRISPTIVGTSTRSFRTSLGAPIAPDSTFTDARRVDVAVVPDLNIPAGEGPVGRWPKAAAWLRRQYESGGIICSVCTGSLMLAEAGLLDGHEATSHWSANPLFRKNYPKVKLLTDRVLLPAGKEHRIVTGGGSSAWSDLALYLIARFCGAEEARRIAKIFLFGDRADGQLPFARVVRPSQHDDEVIHRLQLWIAENYASSNPVSRIESLSELKPRTMKRRFKAATGYTPIEYVQSMRVEEAKQLLEATSQSIDVIAGDVGYSDTKSFRILFRRLTGVSPLAYRRRFQSIGTAQK